MSIFVGNLPFRAEREDVIQLFAPFGEVLNCSLPLERGLLFKNLKIDEFKKFHPEFEEDLFVDLEPLNVVKSRTSEGGTGFVQVEEELNNWKKKLLL